MKYFHEKIVYINNRTELFWKFCEGWKKDMFCAWPGAPRVWVWVCCGHPPAHGHSAFCRTQAASRSAFCWAAVESPWPWPQTLVRKASPRHRREKWQLSKVRLPKGRGVSVLTVVCVKCVVFQKLNMTEVTGSSAKVIPCSRPWWISVFIWLHVSTYTVWYGSHWPDVPF